MAELFKNLPEVISRSASSRLGILALMIIAMAILAFVLFRRASERSRIAIFVMLLLGVAVLAGVIMRQNAGVQKEQAGELAGPGPTENSGRIPEAANLPAELEVTNEKIQVGDAGTYEILSAKLGAYSDTAFSLRFDYRFTSGDDINVVGSDFRLVIDGIPRAPTDNPFIRVERLSANEGFVVFEVPQHPVSVALQIGNPRYATRSIPLDLNARKH